MVVILTEDISTGYDFLKLLHDKIFITPVEIYHTAYRDPEGNGGNSKFEQAIDFLLDDGKLRSNDTLFLAYDNIIPTKPGMPRDRKFFQQQMARCEKKLQSNQITYFKSDYVCIEELLLSFSQIVEFCSSPSRSMTEPAVRIWKMLQTIISSHTQNVAYAELFKEPINRGATIEKCLKVLLRNITQDKGFRGFYLTDAKIGECWQSDCGDLQPRFHPTRMGYCESCYAVHNLTAASPDLAKTRVGYLYSHSLFQSTFSPLGLEVSPIMD